MYLSLVLASVLFFRVECAKILGVFPAPGYSQFILAEVLMKEVANRGHEVTVISAYRPKNEPKNYRTILVEEVFKSGADFDLLHMETKSFFENIMATYRFGNEITENTLQNKDVQNLLRSDEEFDLVIVEQFFDEALKGFAAHFGAPLVLFTPMGITEWNKGYMEIPSLPTFNAIIYSSYTNQMSFFQRVKNLAGTIFDYLYRNFVFHPTQREFLQKYFPRQLDFDKIINNASLMFLNSHVTTSENVLLPYNMVEIGGFHVSANPLNKETQELLDNATNGAVLFSLGTNIHSSDLSPEAIRSIFKVFGNMKQTILWKLPKDFPDKPKNVYISKWFKQSDILAHPNMKLFITHGGLLSVTEAIFHGVPMVGTPAFADQGVNIARAKSLGIATKTSLLELTESSFSSAINEILHNPKYKDNIQKISKLLKDRPQKPLDLAMYWIEHVIRHKGFHFEAPGANLYWFQVYMIDILCFIVFNLTVLYMVIKRTFVFRKKSKSDKKNKDFINKKKKKEQ